MRMIDRKVIVGTAAAALLVAGGAGVAAAGVGVAAAGVGGSDSETGGENSGGAITGDALQRAHRARAAQPGFQATYRRHRPMVERSIAWLVRGNRRVPYRGVDKNHAWLGHRVAAINLRRLLALGLHLDQGTWALAAG